MFSFSNNPTFFEIFKSIFFLEKNFLNHKVKSEWLAGNKNYYKFFSRSSWILFYLCALRIEKKKRIVVWCPNYYCNETIFLIKKLPVDLKFYNLDKDFSPNLQSLNNLSLISNPDIILFCNFFGMSKFLPEIKDYSKKNDAWLIEDCTHCISANNKIGKYGDIAFFSPYKFFPIPNGAIMTTSEKFLDDNKIKYFFENNFFLLDLIKNLKFNKTNDFIFIFKWIIKKIVKNFSFNFLKIEKFNYNQKISNITYFNYPLIDYFSKNLFSIYISKLHENKSNRIRMLYLWRNYLSQYPEFNNKCFKRNLFNLDEVPYYLIISEKNEIKKKYQFLKKKKLPILMWPSLPNETNRSASEIKKSNLFIPLHDQQNKILKKIILKEEKTNITLYLNKIANQNFQKYYEDCHEPNLTQSIDYCYALSKIYNLIVESYIVTDNNGNNIAIFQLIKKKLFFFNYYRINKGPLFFKDIGDQHKSNTIKLLINTFGKSFSYFFFTPNLNFNYKNILTKIKNKLFYFSNPSWKSILIDLTANISDLEKNLKLNWKYALNKSIRDNLKIQQNFDDTDIDHIIKLNKEDSKKKNFNTINNKFLNFFIKNSNCKIFKAFDNNNIFLATICIALHYPNATYLLGHSNHNGRKKNAMNFLLWNSIKLLKKDGYKSFDLGGIDEDFSKGVSKFKMGLGGKKYELVGDLKIFKCF